MHSTFEIDPDMSIDEVMRLWPQTITIILGHEMHCVGCPLAPFHTSIDAAVEHSIETKDFLLALDNGLAAGRKYE